MYKLEFNASVANKIPDVQKAQELKDEIARIFEIRDFHEFQDFVEDDDLCFSFADKFADRYGFYSPAIQDKLRQTALKILNDLNAEYKAFYEDFQEYLNETDDDAEIMHLERTLKSNLDHSLHWGSYDLANVVLAVREARIKKEDLVLAI